MQAIIRKIEQREIDHYKQQIRVMRDPKTGRYIAFYGNSQVGLYDSRKQALEQAPSTLQSAMNPKKGLGFGPGKSQSPATSRPANKKGNNKRAKKPRTGDIRTTDFGRKGKAVHYR